MESVGCALGFLLWVAIVRFSPELPWSSIILPWPLSALLVGHSIYAFRAHQIRLPHALAGFEPYCAKK